MKFSGEEPVKFCKYFFKKPKVFVKYAVNQNIRSYIMSEDFEIAKNETTNQEKPVNNEANRVIDEANYRIHAPRESGPTAVGKGGDPLFRRIRASKDQLLELIEETQTVQDWIQRETCNNVALSCLDNENLKEIYYEIKDGFGEYGKISLMGFKTPSGVEIPRLKVYDTNGEVLEVLTGPMAMDELNKRALAYRESLKEYEEMPVNGDSVTGIIPDYSGNPDDYVT